MYSDSPTIITIWLTIMPKIAILIFLLDLQIQIGIIGNSFSLLEGINFNFSDNILNISRNLLLLSSLLSLIFGTIVGLNQIKIKRLLAYSTISHIGFLLLSLAINSQQSIESFLFYIIQYTITNLNTFLIIIALGYIIHFSLYNTGVFTSSFESTSLKASSRTAPEGQASQSNLNLLNQNESVNALINSKNSEKVETTNTSLIVKENSKLQLPSTDIITLSEFTGQFFSNPLLALSLTICLFSMAGIPPLLGFFSKLFVLLSAISSGYYLSLIHI